MDKEETHDEEVVFSAATGNGLLSDKPDGHPHASDLMVYVYDQYANKHNT